MILTDKTLVCRDCGEEFVFTVGEQEFYQEKGFTNEPKRCPDCRKAKKQDRRSGSKRLYTVICAECGRETQVPFEPKTGKPVYCRECFESRRI